MISICLPFCLMGSPYYAPPPPAYYAPPPPTAYYQPAPVVVQPSAYYVVPAYGWAPRHYGHGRR